MGGGRRLSRDVDVDVTMPWEVLVESVAGLYRRGTVSGEAARAYASDLPDYFVVCGNMNASIQEVC